MSDSTYENCYEMVKNIALDLDIINSSKQVDDFVEGINIAPKYTVKQIVRKINEAQRLIYGLLITRIPNVFLASASITGVDSVFALPWDFGKLVVFKDNYGNKVFPIDIDKLKLVSSTGNKRLYYRKGTDLVLDRDSITDTYTLWYRTKPRDLDIGAASAEDTLASSAKAIADFYNGMTIENVTDGEADEITNYTAARVITHTETLDSGDFYGIVSDLPEMFHCLLAPKAMLLIQELPTWKEKPSKSDKDNFTDLLITQLRAFAGSSEDITVEEIFLDLEPSTPTRLGIVANVS